MTGNEYFALDINKKILHDLSWTYLIALYITMGLGTIYENKIRPLPTCKTTNTISMQRRLGLNWYNNKLHQYVDIW